MKWLVEEDPWPKGPRNFVVRKATWKPHEHVTVWVSDGQARCTQCSGPLSAMLTTCAHAQAVKRFIDKERPVKKKRVPPPRKRVKADVTMTGPISDGPDRCVEAAKNLLYNWHNVKEHHKYERVECAIQELQRALPQLPKP